MTISLCMIVKNEEDVLERCLNSVKNLVDEIIIVDTGSTDNTKSIAKNFTDKVFDYVWDNNFSNARNYSFSLATSDYIMWMDADDVMSEVTAAELLKLKQSLCADVYMLKYAMNFIDEKPTFSFYRERIIKNCKQCFWQGCVHECITPFGDVEKLNLPIEHRKEKVSNPMRNLNIYKQTLKVRPLNPREQYYYSRELFDHKKYKKCITELKKFINGGQGWIENVIDAHYLLALCYEQVNMPNKSLEALLKTFTLDVPRANICCKIGDFFIENKNYEISTFWHELATNCQDVTTKGGFVDEVYYNYYPFLQLCKSYYNLGNIEKAIYYNNKAGEVFPKSEIVKQNKVFFENLKNK